MDRRNFLQIVIAAASCSASSRVFGQVDPTSLPLVQAADISYLGFFNLPAQAGGSEHEWAMEYGGVGLGMGPSNTIFVGGHVWYDKLARFNIPNIGETAAVISNLVPVPGTFDNSSNEQHLGGSLYWNDRLIVTKFGTYAIPEDFVTSHTSAALDLSGWTPPQATDFADPSGRVAAGYMGIVPPEWRGLFGKPCFTGSGPRSINSNSSRGPALLLFDPAEVDGTGIIGTTTVLYYDSAHALWVESNQVGGAAWVPNTRSILFFGQAGAGNPQYQQPPNVTDPCDSGPGYHDYPYRLNIWAYDANDLLAVKSGTKQPWEPVIYGNWPTPGYGSGSGCNRIDHRSGCFDPTNNRYYMCENYGGTPRVHVWQIAGFL